LKTEELLEEKRETLEQLKDAAEIDVQAIISKQVLIEELEDGLKRAKALKDELFPSTVVTFKTESAE
jgi:hypothetical protein